MFWGRNGLDFSLIDAVIKYFFLQDSFHAPLSCNFVMFLIQYFGFWMSEHPDLMDATDIVVLTEDKQESNQNNTTSTLQSRGADTTIGR